MLIVVPIFFQSTDQMSEDAAETSAPGFSADEQDILWMLRVAQGDTVAFEQLIEAHQTRVVGTIAKILGDEMDAEDIAQQVFIRIWNSASRYQPTAKFTTWLFKITRNLVFNELRRRKRHPAVNIEEPDEERHFQMPDRTAPPPDVSMLDQEMQAAIQRAIDSLPEIQRMAIVLRRYEDLSYEEIANVLSLSVPAVKSLLFRARGDLREKLQQYLEG